MSGLTNRDTDQGSGSVGAAFAGPEPRVESGPEEEPDDRGAEDHSGRGVPIDELVEVMAEEPSFVPAFEPGEGACRYCVCACPSPSHSLCSRVPPSPGGRGEIANPFLGEGCHHALPPVRL